jgi:probable HAF family extracellular repeat protein
MRYLTPGRQVLLAACLGTFGVAIQAAPVRYDCRHLADPGDSDGAVPLSINQRGDVTGYSGIVEPWGYQAVIWKPSGQHIALPPLYADSSLAIAADVNDRGHAVGYGDGKALNFRAISWKKGGPAKALPPLTGGALNGAASAINNAGDIVGYSGVPDGSSRNHATLWRDHLAFDLGALGSRVGQLQRNSRATDINEAGIIVGESELPGVDGVHAVRWDTPKRIVDLGTLPGANTSSAQAINLSGTVVGYSETSGVSRLAVAWSTGGIRALGLPPGHVGSEAWGVNDHDVVVGHSGASGVDRHAVVWFGLDAAPALLDDLVDGGCVDAAGQAHRLTRAYAINNSGTIAAMSRSYQNGQFVTTTFKLTPR